MLKWHHSTSKIAIARQPSSVASGVLSGPERISI
jgi:hypothetical protein